MRQHSPKTNAEAYAKYRRHIEVSRERLTGQEAKLRSVDPRVLLVHLIGLWNQRYYRLMEAIQLSAPDGSSSGWLDTYARKLLMARHRAQNAPYGLPADFSQQQIDLADQMASRSLSEVKSLKGIPSYGPSFNRLWAQAKSRDLSKEEAARFILEWSCHAPLAWARDDDRQQKHLPMIDPGVTRRLEQSVMWSSKDDLFVPWNAEVDGRRWEVRINDFPDEYMYSLLIDGLLLGDFHDWPKTWDRGEPKVEVPARKKPPVPPKRAPLIVDAGKLLARYQAGECEAVWRDLVALGPDVRKPPYDVPTEAVARETIRRAKHNFELIVQRLHSLNYQFDGNRWHEPANEKNLQDLAAWEEAGLLVPTAVRLFIEEMNIVSLMGTHPLLCPKVRIADPLFLLPDAHSWMIELWSEGEKAGVVPENGEVFQIHLCTSPMSKQEHSVNNSMIEEWFSIQLPNAAADAVLLGEPQGRTLVEYLRWCFEWGGFPGWEKETSRPEKELAFLRNGLLPI